MLISQEVVLRPIERSDLEMLNVWWNDPTLSAALGTRRHLSALEETEAWYESSLGRIEAHEGRTYAIAGAVDGRLLGTVWYGDFSPQDRNVEIGLYLGDEPERGRKLGGQVLQLLLAYLFGDLAIHKVRLLVPADNHRAIRCYESVGFKREGLLRHHRFFAGSHHDFIAMGLLAAERNTW